MWRQASQRKRSVDGVSLPTELGNIAARSLRRRGPAWCSSRCLLLALLVVLAVTALGVEHLHSPRQMHQHHLSWMPRRIRSTVVANDATLRSSETEAGVEKTLMFNVCGGFAQQRIAIISGAILAAELNRTLVLPRLQLDATVPGGSLSTKPPSSAFGDLYDLEHFLEALSAIGIRVAVEQPARADTVRLSVDYDFMAFLTGIYSHARHLRVGCPALKLPPDLVVKHEELVFAVLDALQPAKRLADVIFRIEERLRSMAEPKSFNVLHLKAESDWQEYCERWRQTDDGTVRDNCGNNTDTVGDQLELRRVGPQLPLYLALSWALAQPELVQTAMHNLEAHRYKAVLRDEILGPDANLPALARDEAALVDYYLALRSHQFAGNSVSIFSALLIMERWHAGKYATYYNGGNIPLEGVMPLYKMPWVFTYNDWSAGTEYDYMVRAAVVSGIDAARMKPYCMYSGGTESEMYKFFITKGVTIIQHTPAWKDALAKEGARNREFNAKTRSHLYKSDGALIGTYQRIDIPILPHFDQYNYVLFTDCDVFFRQHMKLIDWGTPLPEAMGMGYEMDDNFPYNAGIMLMNMAYMRKTNKAFVDWIFAQQNGLYYEGYGAVDQGAFNQYYEKQIRGKPISKNFNAMIYHPFRKAARIVHMHGPKPNHYLEWLLTGKCAFRDMCQLGFRYGLCQYIDEYITFAADWKVARTLHQLCTQWRSGTWHMQWSGG